MEWISRLPSWEQKPDFFFVIAPKPTWEILKAQCQGIPWPVWWIDPWVCVTQSSGVQLVQVVLQLERVLFGPSLATPGWAYYDCHLLNGFACGLGVRSQHSLAQVIRFQASQKGVSLSSSADLPISHFVLVKHPVEGYWVAVNLWSINGLLNPPSFPQLGFVTKALGIHLAGYPRFWGVTQWSNAALKLHVRFGVTRLISALTGIHTRMQSLTYECEPKAETWLLPGPWSWTSGFEPHPIYRVPWPESPEFENQVTLIQKALESHTQPLFLLPEAVADYFEKRVPLTLAVRS